MTVTRLTTHRVEKPWGRAKLWPGFDDPAPGGDPVGEVWFQTPGDDEPELLVKYLFTSEKLSIQVHPNDEEARARGYARGKDEAWVILEAEPESTIALGTVREASRDELRAAALDGSIEQLMDWKHFNAGDTVYSPAGTVHAIGAGLTLVEVQQNVDLTYRLYDYGRPRELHLDDGVAVSDPAPFAVEDHSVAVDDGRTILFEGPKFVLERWTDRARRVDLPEGMTGWFVPLKGKGSLDGADWAAGECYTLTGEALLAPDEGAEMLFAYPGDKRI